MEFKKFTNTTTNHHSYLHLRQSKSTVHGFVWAMQQRGASCRGRCMSSGYSSKSNPQQSKWQRQLADCGSLAAFDSSNQSPGEGPTSLSVCYPKDHLTAPLSLSSISLCRSFLCQSSEFLVCFHSALTFLYNICYLNAFVLSFFFVTYNHLRFYLYAIIPSYFSSVLFPSLFSFVAVHLLSVSYIYIYILSISFVLFVFFPYL